MAYSSRTPPPSRDSIFLEIDSALTAEKSKALKNILSSSFSIEEKIAALLNSEFQEEKVIEILLIFGNEPKEIMASITRYAGDSIKSINLTNNLRKRFPSV